MITSSSSRTIEDTRKELIFKPFKRLHGDDQRRRDSSLRRRGLRSSPRSFLQKELLSLPPEERAPAFGRALGRVLAHELYYIFANTKHHGSEGVGRSFYSARDLLTPEFQFESRESTLLKNSKVHTALSAAGTELPEIEP